MSKNIPCENNVYASALPARFGDSDLKALFGEFGVILSAKVMLDVKTGVSKGIGFVLFEQTSCALEAVAKLNGVTIDDRRIQVRIADRTAAFAPIESSRVFLRNLPPATPVEDVVTHCSQFGEVIEHWLHTDSRSNGGNNDSDMYYVEFKTKGEAEKCVDASHNHFLFGSGQSVPVLAKLVPMNQPLHASTSNKVRKAPAKKSTAPPPKPLPKLSNTPQQQPEPASQVLPPPAGYPMPMQQPQPLPGHGYTTMPMYHGMAPAPQQYFAQPGPPPPPMMIQPPWPQTVQYSPQMFSPPPPQWAAGPTSTTSISVEPVAHDGQPQAVYVTVYPDGSTSHTTGTPPHPFSTQSSVPPPVQSVPMGELPLSSFFVEGSSSMQQWKPPQGP